jgi:hypothetical protein
MTTAKSISISVTVSILIGSVAFFFFAGPELAKGSGRYEASALLFPYAFLVFHLVPSGALLLPLMFAQFPAYGLFYAWAWRKNREDRAVAWLLATHLVLGVSASLLCRIDYRASLGRYPF